MNPVAFDFFPRGYGIRDTEIYHTWNMETGETVHLIVENGDLFYQVIGDEVANTFPIEIPENLTLAGAIHQMKQLTPILQVDGSLAFVAPQMDPWVSLFDDQLVLNEENWSLTLADIGGSHSVKGLGSLNTYLTVAGHAAILVEKVVRGQYEIEKVHITSDRVERKVITVAEALARVKARTETWTTPKFKVQEMLYAVDLEKEEVKENPIHFHPRGKGSLGVKQDGIYHNCYTWARAKLALAGIHIDQEPMVRVQIAALPRIKLSERNLTSKKSVYVHLNPTEGAKEFIMRHQYSLSYVNITDSVHKYVASHFQKRSWKPMPQVAPEGYDLSVQIDVNEEGSGLGLSERAILPIKIKGIGVHEVDVTGVIQHQLKPFDIFREVEENGLYDTLFNNTGESAVTTPSNGCIIL